MLFQDCTPANAQTIILLLLFMIVAIFSAVFIAFPHLLKGDFKSKDELKKYLLIGYFVMASAIISAMILYNIDNPYYSIFEDTFSFLGAWKCHENPSGWFFFTINMIVFGLWSIPLVLYMGKRLFPLDRVIASFTTFLMILGCIGMILVGIFPDVQENPDFFGGAISGQTHNLVSLIAFGGLGIGILINALLLRKDFDPRFPTLPITPKSGRRILDHKKVSKPYIMIMVIVFCVAFFLITWEIVWPIYYQPLGVGHWPGEHIFSFPFWEWTAIMGVYTWLGWFPMSLPQEIPKSREEISSENNEN